MRAFHSATGDGRRPHVSLRYRALHMRQHRRCPNIGLNDVNLFVSANVLAADRATIIMLLLFFIGVCQDDLAALPPQLSAAAAVFQNASIQTKYFPAPALLLHLSL